MQNKISVIVLILILVGSLQLKAKYVKQDCTYKKCFAGNNNKAFSIAHNKDCGPAHYGLFNEAFVKQLSITAKDCTSHQQTIKNEISNWNGYWFWILSGI